MLLFSRDREKERCSDLSAQRKALVIFKHSFYSEVVISLIAIQVNPETRTSFPHIVKQQVSATFEASCSGFSAVLVYHTDTDTQFHLNSYNLHNHSAIKYGELS